jgi:hypothetical protein
MAGPLIVSGPFYDPQVKFLSFIDILVDKPLYIRIIEGFQI